jgi:hypothetical protein
MNYYKLTQVEKWMVIVILAGLGLDSIFLYRSLTETSRDIGDSLRVGLIQYVAGEVKIRPSESTLWDTARPNDFVANLDKVFNAPESHSKVAIDNGAIVELRSNTLVQFFKDKESFGIDISSGDVQVDSTVAVSSVLLRLSGEDRHYALEKKGKINISLAEATRGRDVQCKAFEITVEDPSAPTQERQQVDCLGNIRKMESRGFIPILPNPDMITYESQPFEFRWRRLPGEAGENLRLAVYQLKDEAFQRVFEQSIGEATQESLGMSGLEAGSYRWQLETSDGKDVSNPEHFRIRKIPFPVIQYPKDTFAIYENTRSVFFKWQRPFHQPKVRFQIATDVQFQNLMVDRETLQTREEVSGTLYEDLVAKKLFYWRVLPSLETFPQELLQAHPIPFEETRVEKASALLTPSPGEIIPKTVDPLNPISFKWPEGGYDQYIFELKDQSENSLLTKSTHSTRVSVDRLPAGFYRWNVKGERGETQETLINSQFLIPGGEGLTEDSVQISSAQNQTSPLDWDLTFAFDKPYLLADYYDIKLVNKANGKEITKFRQLPPEDGLRSIYQGLASQNYVLKVFPKNSEAAVFEYPVFLQGKSPVPPPKHMALSQSPGAEGSKRVHLSWTGNPHAQSYEVLIYPAEVDRALAEPQQKIQTPANQATVSLDNRWTGKTLLIQAYTLDHKGHRSEPSETTVVIK